ncbi:hypothetical protein B0T24DRAFT_595218 [Lasiosphaeria ovina]|uniref:Uncharacterized protein n=1 Tax=Lasiosphaeria ovina TaxID=92902 RepID=A0AAE0N5C8_9PEZI|nr:hypothetical protein B0T24DRAFT_595218 [Lasiosphaeria ovina]
MVRMTWCWALLASVLAGYEEAGPGLRVATCSAAAPTSPSSPAGEVFGGSTSNRATLVYICRLSEGTADEPYIYEIVSYVLPSPVVVLTAGASTADGDVRPSA